MKVVRLSTLRTVRLYSPGNTPGTHFCLRLSRPQGHSAAGRIVSENVRESNPRPSGLYRSASTNCATAYITYNGIIFYLSSCNQINPLKPELHPICYLLALLGAHHFLRVSRIRVKSLTIRLLMSYIYIYIYIWSPYS